MTETVTRLRRDWRPALLAHLGRGEESGLNMAYQLGRGAVAADIGLLDLVGVHQTLVAELVGDPTASDIPALVASCDAFLLEALAPYEMTRQGYPAVTGP